VFQASLGYTAESCFKTKPKPTPPPKKKAIKKIKDKGRSIHILQDSSLPQSPQIEMNQWLPTELP
jgi:hypothetical protein